MLAAKRDEYITEQQYLEGEKLAKERHEYVDGKVYAMAGTSRRHNQIALNIAFATRQAGKGTNCETLSSDVKVRVGKRKTYYYPDVVVGCDADDTNPYYLEKPCLIVEVTSKSTEWKDRHEKAVVYQSIESLQAYMVVSQEKPHVTLYYREEDDGSWWVTALEDMAQTITLKCPETTLTLADIYDGIDFSQPAE